MSLAVSDAVVRRAVVMLMVLSAACGSSAPTSPTVTQPSTPALPPSPPPRTFPPLVGPSRTFVFDHQVSYSVAEYTKKSRFILYDNGGFVLRYAGLGEYRGGYTEANGVIVFEWEGWNIGGAWAATGTLRGDLLTIQYNLIMQLSDFEDAVYAFVVEAP